jgi:hypothetical protein
MHNEMSVRVIKSRWKRPGTFRGLIIAVSRSRRIGDIRAAFFNNNRKLVATRSRPRRSTDLRKEKFAMAGEMYHEHHAFKSQGVGAGPRNLQGEEIPIVEVRGKEKFPIKTDAQFAEVRCPLQHLLLRISSRSSLSFLVPTLRIA